MAKSLTADDILLMSDLISKNNEELKKHISDQIRMVKLTVQENHAVSVEARDFGKVTNGRVTKLENEVYGEKDPNGNIIRGREGIINRVNNNKEDIENKISKYKKKIIYSAIAVTVFLMSLQIPIVSSFVTKVLNLIGKII